TLFINSALDEAQKAFIFGEELGYHLLEHPRKSKSSFETQLNDYRASYFSGALLLDETLFCRDLAKIFSKSSVAGDEFLELLNGCRVSSEVFMHRLTQLLPHHFKLNQLFFLRCNEDYLDRNKSYYISKELHLSQLHNPHGVNLHEHYCRRWITVWLLEELSKKMNEKSLNGLEVGLQRSKMVDNENEYFCLSIARPSKIKKRTNSCLTVGILINQEFKDTVKFWNDSGIINKEVGQTCERCPIEDCSERVAVPTIHRSLERKKKEKIAVQEILNS
ncbi:MAG: ImmA/IrrE family metallo-endopeptidase, partial [Halobacteriovoraceae bacterium]|nr:ImmA/IrrE family metallo-endopeptidase [Halobacteriovoraceae bacterium]